MNNYEPVEIIIVEDNPYDCELMVRELSKNNLANHITSFENGEDALDYLLGSDQHNSNIKGITRRIILLDLHLPKMSGMDVLKELKSNPLTKKIPVIMITSSKEDPDINKAYELGANSYIIKSIEMEDFIKAIENLSLYWLLVCKVPAE